MSFLFISIGSSIQILGTTNRVNTTSGFNPSWECSIDDISIGATQPFQYAENNWELCGQPQLVDGHHVVTVKVIQATATGRTFWFDDITYTPSSNVSTNGAYVLVQNDDPGVVYGTGWGPLGTTANFTTQTGAELSFNFTGMIYPFDIFCPHLIHRRHRLELVRIYTSRIASQRIVRHVCYRRRQSRYISARWPVSDREHNSVQPGLLFHLKSSGWSTQVACSSWGHRSTDPTYP